jgi:hypothetical protein
MAQDLQDDKTIRRGGEGERGRGGESEDGGWKIEDGDRYTENREASQRT